MRKHLRLRPESGQSGQALAEFALISVLLALLLMGAIEFGFLFGHKLELANGARSGARWAAGHPTAWTKAATPASNSIEGQIAYAGGTQLLPNDDTHVLIEYFAVSGSTITPCGRWSVTSNSFVGAGAYTQASCVIDGNLVRVTAVNTYPLLTALIKVAAGGATMRASASMVLIG